MLEDTFPPLQPPILLRIFEEYVRGGKTDNNILTEKNIHVKGGNTRQFLTHGIITLPEGDLGETTETGGVIAGANILIASKITLDKDLIN